MDPAGGPFRNELHQCGADVLAQLPVLNLLMDKPTHLQHVRVCAQGRIYQLQLFIRLLMVAQLQPALGGFEKTQNPWVSSKRHLRSHAQKIVRHHKPTADRNQIVRRTNLCLSRNCPSAGWCFPVHKCHDQPKSPEIRRKLTHKFALGVRRSRVQISPDRPFQLLSFSDNCGWRLMETTRFLFLENGWPSRLAFMRFFSAPTFRPTSRFR